MQSFWIKFQNSNISANARKYAQSSKNGKYFFFSVILFSGPLFHCIVFRSSCSISAFSTVFSAATCSKSRNKKSFSVADCFYLVIFQIKCFSALFSVVNYFQPQMIKHKNEYSVSGSRIFENALTCLFSTVAFFLIYFLRLLL